MRPLPFTKTFPTKWSELKKIIIPSGLYARALLMIVLPLIIVQAVTNFIFLDRHLDSITHLLANNIARDVTAVVTFWKEGDQSFEEVVRFAALTTKASLTFVPEKDPAVPMPIKPHRFWGEDELEAELSAILPVPYTVLEDDRNLWIRTYLPDGILIFQISKKQLLSRSTPLVVLVSSILSILVMIAAALFMRNQIKPLALLAGAAERFGKGQNVPDFKLSGAAEVRQVAAAFNVMKERISRQMSQRMTMLASISHDLRTPLTRMKLELALSPPSPYREGLEKDVLEMEVMVEEFLAFIKGDAHEISQDIDLKEILDTLVLDARRLGHDVSLTAPAHLPLKMRPSAMKRALQNLLNNAWRHGRKVEMSVFVEEGLAHIVVDDDGPGIPPEQRLEVFKPFFRLDTARNSETGGAGLGLSIALDSIQGHGGTIVVEDAPLGGARLHVILPL